jgi:hypothetical protein
MSARGRSGAEEQRAGVAERNATKGGSDKRARLGQRTLVAMAA